MVDIAGSTIGGPAGQGYAMKLLDYMKGLDKQKLETFALTCGTSVGQLRQVAYGRRAGAELAIAIDRSSCGEVSCEEVRPDIDWEYLRGSSKAA